MKPKKKQKRKNENTNYKTVTEEVIRNYNAWLSYSNLTEKDFLRYSTSQQFKIQKFMREDGCLSVIISSGVEIIGQPFSSPSAARNQHFMIDLSFLLLYIAQRLDETNLREGTTVNALNGKEYFYKLVKDFLKDAIVTNIK